MRSGGTPGRRIGLTAAGALAVVVAAPTAWGLTVGANLNRPVNAAYGCESLPTTDAFGGRFFLPTGAATCTYLGAGTITSQAEVPGTPATGVALRVRVKVGPVTGPMAITVLRATRSAVGFACCFHAGGTGPFVPAANAVTTLNVRLPMRLDLNPAFGETRDYLGLTVLAPGVPVPLHDEGAPGRVDAPLASAFFPHVGPGQTRADGAGVAGLVPLIQGDIFPLCGGLAERAAHGGACVRRVVVRGATARVRSGVASVSLACNEATPCAGRVRLQSRSAAVRGTRTTFGLRNIRIAPGATAAVTVPLNAGGRALLRTRTSAAVWANVTLGTRAVSATRIRLFR